MSRNSVLLIFDLSKNRCRENFGSILGFSITPSKDEFEIDYLSIGVTFSSYRLPNNLDICNKLCILFLIKIGVDKSMIVRFRR